jgi:hypothetical protein
MLCEYIWILESQKSIQILSIRSKVSLGRFYESFISNKRCKSYVRDNMQCMLCSSSRILSEAIQKIESGTPSAQESCSYTWEHVQVEGASKDVSTSREFSGVHRRGWMYTTASIGTAKDRHLYCTVDLIAHEYHKGGCVPFCE